MLRNYCRIALRNLRKHSFYTVLNVFGLSLGITCCLILFQFITYHLGFDAFHRKSAQIYRVVTDLHLDDGSVQYEKGAPLALAAAIQAEVPQVKNQAFLFHNYRDHSFTVAVPQPGNAARKLFAEQGNVAFADQHWFSLFDYEWERGSSQTALEEPNTAVLTDRQAKKYFGNADPIGKTILVDDSLEVKITGVLKDYPANTATKVDVFISRASMKRFYAGIYASMESEWGWINSSNALFLLLPDDLSPKVVNDLMAGLKRRHMGEMAKYYDFHLQPLNALHFDTRYGGEVPKSLLTILGMVGFIILMIAGVNFINLATAQNATRAKEISTRKILGSSRAAIFWQFMIETALTVLAAAMLSLVWIYFSFPVLNTWFHDEFQLHAFPGWPSVAALILLIIFITMAAGMYPSLLLSRFKPVELLKSRSGGTPQIWLRKGLVMFQHLVAQTLIICTLVILLQTNYLKTTNLGFDKAGVVMIPIPKPDKKDLIYLRSQLMNLTGVKDASFCYRPPASETFRAGSVKFDNREWEAYTALCTLGDARYLSTFGLQLIAGRNLVESDTVREFLVSESMMKKLGFTNPSQVLGHQLVAGALSDHPGIIVGIVGDFHLHSLHRYTEPVLMATRSQDYAFAAIKIGSGDALKSIREIKKVWQSVYPDHIFEYHFLDDQIDAFYRKENLLNKLIGGFTVVAILISCLGLFGLISLLTINRTKEIGIRKVLGASVTNIVLLLSGDFMKLTVAAFIMASLLAWLAMSRWLEGFAYHITMPWWVFLLGGCCSLALTLLTLCYHAIRAAVMNPVKSLQVG